MTADDARAKTMPPARPWGRTQPQGGHPAPSGPPRHGCDNSHVGGSHRRAGTHCLPGSAPETRRPAQLVVMASTQKGPVTQAEPADVAGIVTAQVLIPTCATLSAKYGANARPHRAAIVVLTCGLG
jgi:hypothetical protein